MSKKIHTEPGDVAAFCRVFAKKSEKFSALWEARRKSGKLGSDRALYDWLGELNFYIQWNGESKQVREILHMILAAKEKEF